MKNHLIARKLGIDDLAAHFSDTERNTLQLDKGRIYRHKTMRVNYTTYDMRRDQDSINPRTHADIMVLAPEDHEDSHPFLYARVCGIFHAYVRYGSRDQPYTKVEFLWVRWFKRDIKFECGFEARRLPMVQFIPADREGAFGFLDPAVVIRGSHIVPAFDWGKTARFLGPSRMRQPADEDEDWEYYKVNM